MAFDPLGFFKSRGYTDYQAAAIVGNVYGESSLDHRAVGDGGRAFGLAQWHPDRQANFRRVFGVDIRQSTPEQQWRFIDWELNNTEKKAGNWLRGTSDIKGATFAFMRGYERPADNSSFGKRLGAGLKALTGGTDLLKSGAKALGLGDSAGGLLEGAAMAGLNAALPGSGMVLDALGFGGESCGIICQIQNWIRDSGFFQRLALAILAFIILFAAFYMMKPSIVQGAVKGALNNG